jgi:hypothetical protein
LLVIRGSKCFGSILCSRVVISKSRTCCGRNGRS